MGYSSLPELSLTGGLRGGYIFFFKLLLFADILLCVPLSISSIRKKNRIKYLNKIKIDLIHKTIDILQKSGEEKNIPIGTLNILPLFQTSQKAFRFL